MIRVVYRASWELGKEKRKFNNNCHYYCTVVCETMVEATEADRSQHTDAEKRRKIHGGSYHVTPDETPGLPTSLKAGALLPCQLIIPPDGRGMEEPVTLLHYRIARTRSGSSYQGWRRRHRNKVKKQQQAKRGAMGSYAYILRSIWSRALQGVGCTLGPVCCASMYSFFFHMFYCSRWAQSHTV